MAFRIFIKRLKHYRQNDFDVVANKVAEILIVPEVKCSFCDLWYSSVSICTREKVGETLLGNVDLRQTSQVD